MTDGIRRNVAKISQQERDRLRDAILQLDVSWLYPDGVSYWDKQDEIHQATHVHNGPAFLPWHRELCNRFEALLRQVDPTLSLHYWDWTTDPRSSPDGNGGSVNLFSTGPAGFMGSASGPAGPPFGSFTIRRAVAPGAPGVPPDQTIVTSGDSAAVAAQFQQMRSALESAHGSVHGFIGGTISNAHTAFEDPFVFLLHSNVDRLFAHWQSTPGQEWRLDPDQVYGAEGGTTGDEGILTDMEPWAGASGLRPWAPPENQQEIKNSRHVSVVARPSYDTLCGNPALVQSRFGTRENFELVVPFSAGGLAHYWRDNDDPALPWRGPSPFAAGTVDAVSLIQGNFGNNLEVVARIGGRLAHFWRESGAPWTWHGPHFFGSGVTGTPSLIQGLFGSPGNFEVVVPLAAGGMAHFWRANSDPTLPWYGPSPFAAGVGAVAGCSLIQGSFGNNLEVVARIGYDLAHFWRESAAPWTWHGPHFFASGVSGTPSLIQGRFGSPGNFEVVVPLASGGMAHFWRDNGAPALPWSAPTPFGSGRVHSVSLIQGNFGNNLEVVARLGCSLVHFWRDSGPSLTWHGPNTVVE